MNKDYNKKIKQDDFVKLVRTEPKVTGRVVQVFEDKLALVRWSDGIVAKHFIDELRLIRMDEMSGPWMGF